MINNDAFIQDCMAIRSKRPVIHNITNYVAMNFSANALLAAGASPIMSFCKEEVQDLAAISSALVINIGCLDAIQVNVMCLAAKCFHDINKPWVLDPVGAGATRYRTEVSKRLIEEFKPWVIRCNPSEIVAIAKESGISWTNDLETKGVDSTLRSNSVVEVAKAIALKYKTIVSISGSTDYITDGSIVEQGEHGSPIMERVTAMGCVASAITAAFTSVNENTLQASTHAMLLMGICGERASAKCAGSGTFEPLFLDEIYNFCR